jgi:hypothetical protein
MLKVVPCASSPPHTLCHHQCTPSLALPACSHYIICIAINSHHLDREHLRHVTLSVTRSRRACPLVPHPKCYAPMHAGLHCMMPPSVPISLKPEASTQPCVGLGAP